MCHKLKSDQSCEVNSTNSNKTVTDNDFNFDMNDYQSAGVHVHKILNDKEMEIIKLKKRILNFQNEVDTLLEDREERIKGELIIYLLFVPKLLCFLRICF